MGLFTYDKPKDKTEKNHNADIKRVLKEKLAQMILTDQHKGSSLIPLFKLKTNFLDYYQDYVNKNKRLASRRLECSLSKFKAFMGKDFISPVDLTEDVC